MRDSKKMTQALGLTFFVSMSVWSVFSLAAVKPVIMGIRNGEPAILAFCSREKCSTEQIESDTREFANGNTFVRIKTPVAGKDVQLVIPNQVDFNQFFEILIKIRTLKTDFVNSVSIATAQGNGKINVVDANNKAILDDHLITSMLVSAGLPEIDGIRLQKSHVSFRKPSVTDKYIIVDPETNSPLAASIGKELGIPVMKVDEAKNLLRRGNANVIVVSSPSEPHNLRFLETLQAVYQLRLMGSKVLLVTPYLPYARSDKKDQDGVAVTGRLATDLIENAGVSAVQFVRAHAPQSQGFFSIPSIQSMGRKTIDNYLREEAVEQIVSPDAGFQKDATLYADELGVPVSVINKQRNLQTGDAKVNGISGPDVQGKVVAVIDDETASGGTLAKAADLLKSLGAKKVLAVVTHLAGSASQAMDSAAIDQIVVTDTFDVPTQNAKMKVLSMGPEIATDLQKFVRIAPSCKLIYKD